MLTAVSMYEGLECCMTSHPLNKLNSVAGLKVALLVACVHEDHTVYYKGHVPTPCYRVETLSHKWTRPTQVYPSQVHAACELP